MTTGGDTMARPIKFGKYGMLEDPTERHIVWTSGGRDYIAICKGFYLKKMPGDYRVVMLRACFLNREPAPDVPARDVKVLEEAS
jgi:hypothetical protein